MKKLYTFKNGPVFLAHPVNFQTPLAKSVLHSAGKTREMISSPSGKISRTTFNTTQLSPVMHLPMTVASRGFTFMFVCCCCSVVAGAAAVDDDDDDDDDELHQSFVSVFPSHSHKAKPI